VFRHRKRPPAASGSATAEGDRDESAPLAKGPKSAGLSLGMVAAFALGGELLGADPHRHVRFEIRRDGQVLVGRMSRRFCSAT
jgi:hypothetical protein